MTSLAFILFTNLRGTGGTTAPKILLLSLWRESENGGGFIPGFGMTIDQQHFSDGPCIRNYFKFYV